MCRKCETRFAFAAVGGNALPRGARRQRRRSIAPPRVFKNHSQEARARRDGPTVKSAWPAVRVISERRVPLAMPVGKGRSGNVQPDYGLWRHESGVETCGLVIEVKHYKRSASTSFGHVLADYSRAFPTAEVY